MVLEHHSMSLSASGTRGLPGTQDPGLAVLGARVLPGVRGKGLRSLPGFGAMDVSKPYKFIKFGGPSGPSYIHAAGTNSSPDITGAIVVHTSRPMVG